MNGVMAALLGGALVAILVVAGLLALEVWLAGRTSPLPGLVQPALWVLLAVLGNVLPRLQGSALHSGVYGIGAIVMAGLTLAAYLITRRRGGQGR